MRRAVLTLALAATAFAPIGASAQKHAPDLTLTTTSQARVRIGDLEGKVVLLDFWASWCVPCRRSFPELDALYRELSPKGLSVVAINVDEQTKNADAFLASHPHVMPVALDPKGLAATAFELQAMPSSILLDRHGTIRFMHQGYTEKTIAQFRSEILELLAEGR